MTEVNLLNKQIYKKRQLQLKIHKFGKKIKTSVERPIQKKIKQKYHMQYSLIYEFRRRRQKRRKIRVKALVRARQVSLSNNGRTFGFIQYSLKTLSLLMEKRRSHTNYTQSPQNFILYFFVRKIFCRKLFGFLGDITKR